jgi:serine phosphatase RsbU (regulator of sigma subunit)
MKGPVTAAAVAVILILLWAIVTISRRGRLAHGAASGAQARDALRQFAEQSLTLQSVADITILVREAATVIFGCPKVMAFQPGTDEGAWDASVPGQGPLPELPPALRGLFGWFKHNTAIAAAGDVDQPRFGAMRGPLRQVMERYGVDVLMPLVAQGQLMAVVGMQLGRKPTVLDRDLMRLLRLQATAACANVRLHVEAAHMVTLAREVDLASAVELALVPRDKEGSLAGLRWAGHYQASGDAGSDFWGVYQLEDGRTLVLIGDAVGHGLAGSMVSAVVKSCADAIFDSRPKRIDPSTLLGALNRALYRSHNPVHASCFALLIDPAGKRLNYANAGHPFPYHIGSASGALGVLSGAGPLLGDEAAARYKVHEAALAEGETFVLITDGLVKAQDPSGKAFGERKLQRLLAEHAGASPAGVRSAILGAIATHRADTPLSDDSALLVVRWS